MRAQARHVRHEEEEESAFVSMTDMTVGFLFIMMILLAFFASQAKETDTVPRSSFNEVVEERDELRAKVEEVAAQNATLVLQLASAEARIEELTEEVAAKDEEIARLRAQLVELQRANPLEVYREQVSDARRKILEQLHNAIENDFPEVKMKISKNGDALHFQGEGFFNTNSWDLKPDKAKILASLGKRLDEILPCFTLGPKSRFDESCNPTYAIIEAVQIEGHTDARGDINTNQTLSTNRANTTYFTMIGKAKDLETSHHNLEGQPVLSVAAYGPNRPIDNTGTEEGHAANRRIDLRFIMETPTDLEGIERIRLALRNAPGVWP